MQSSSSVSRRVDYIFEIEPKILYTSVLGLTQMHVQFEVKIVVFGLAENFVVFL